MNKAELITETALRTGVTRKDTERVVNVMLDIMTAELAKCENMKLSGFGIFEVKERKAHKGRNPKTGEAMEIPACKAVQFRSGKNLKEAVDNAN